MVYINKDPNKVIKHSDYSSVALGNISSDELKETVTSKEYSKTVEVALTNKTFVASNIDTYYAVSYKNEADFIENINNLATLGYKTTDITTIFGKFNASDIKILCDTKYISDITEYLKFDYFILSNLNRYLDYKVKNNYDYEKTITYVNSNLDYDFYDPNIIKSSNNPESELVLVNKYTRIDRDYAPALVTLSKNYSLKTLQVTNNTKTAFEKMCDDASKENLTIKAASTYRTYDYQNTLYTNYVTTDSKENADTYSARPGHSEHHTGLALDISNVSLPYSDFGSTKEYEWVTKNAHLYGFIVRYPEGKTSITGYIYEPWHIRYVGIDVATYIYTNDITFDEYYARFLTK